MRDFHQWMQNEGIFDSIKGALGFGGGWQPPQPIPSQYQKYFKQLVMKHGGDPKAAYAEYQQLLATPAGQYQMQRVNASMADPTPVPGRTGNFGNTSNTRNVPGGNTMYTPMKSNRSPYE